MYVPQGGEPVSAGQAVGVLDLVFRVPDGLSGVVERGDPLAWPTGALLAIHLDGIPSVGHVWLFVFPFGKHSDATGHPAFNDNFVTLATPPALAALAGDRSCALVRWKERQLVCHLTREAAVIQVCVNKGSSDLDGARSVLDSMIAGLSQLG